MALFVTDAWRENVCGRRRDNVVGVPNNEISASETNAEGFRLERNTPSPSGSRSCEKVGAGVVWLFALGDRPTSQPGKRSSV